MSKYMPSICFKMSNSKLPHLEFCRFSDCLKYKKINKNKTEVWCMLFQISEICTYESDYVTLYSQLSILQKTAPK